MNHISISLAISIIAHQSAVIHTDVSLPQLKHWNDIGRPSHLWKNSMGGMPSHHCRYYAGLHHMASVSGGHCTLASRIRVDNNEGIWKGRTENKQDFLRHMKQHNQWDILLLFLLHIAASRLLPGGSIRFTHMNDKSTFLIHAYMEAHFPHRLIHEHLAMTNWGISKYTL